MDWILMVASFVYAGLVVFVFGIGLAKRIEGMRKGERQPFETGSKFNLPPLKWWGKRLGLIALGYVIAIAFTWGAYTHMRDNGFWGVTDLATVFSASMSAVFTAPALLLVNSKE